MFSRLKILDSHREHITFYMIYGSFGTANRTTSHDQRSLYKLPARNIQKSFLINFVSYKKYNSGAKFTKYFTIQIGYYNTS